MHSPEKQKLILKLADQLEPYFKKVTSEEDVAYHQAHLLACDIICGQIKDGLIVAVVDTDIK